MNKQAFLAQLREGLAGLPEEEKEERLAFYGEMIDDRMEEGLPEETAVREAGSVSEIVTRVIADIPLTKLVREKIAPKKKRNAWETVLLILGSPVWLSLLIAVLAVAFSLYAAAWAVLISLWAVFASLAACGAAGLAAGIFFAFGGHGLTGLAAIGAGMLCAGLSVFAFFGCRAATVGLLSLTKKLAARMKKGLMKGEETR